MIRVEQRPLEPVSADLLVRLEAKGFLILQGPDITAYLNARGANAATFGTRELLLRSDPRKLEVLEEFLHHTQLEIGLQERLTLPELEAHVKEFMVRHQRWLRLVPEDIAWLEAWLQHAKERDK